MTDRKNQVLTDQFRSSSNLYESDLLLQHHLKKLLGEKYAVIQNRLAWMGKAAATEMDELSLKADSSPPVLEHRNKWGEDVQSIVFHPAYERLVEIAVESNMFRIKWHPDNIKAHEGYLNQMSFAISSIYAMAETGVYCPLCMTDGVAVLIDRFCEQEDKDRLLPAIYTKQIEDFKSGAMYLTEKAGGSDVGANMVTATKKDETTYILNGEKWFCSNASGEIAFALARTDASIHGTKGLSIFLVEKDQGNGKLNPMQMVRLKDKLGVRSMASAEIIFTDTEAKMVGEEFTGFKVMTHMINLSRVYNTVAAVSASRRALTEAYQFVKGRTTFGQAAMQHSLIRKKLEELGSLQVANFYLQWRAIEALDSTDPKDQDLLRLLTPMAKKWTAEKGVYITREAMELMGGIGYIEDQIMPKLMRDIMVLPIWEGAGNIMMLDMLRASMKSDQGLKQIFNEIGLQFKNKEYGAFLQGEVANLQGLSTKLFQLPEDELQANAPLFFDRLTVIYQMSLMLEYRDEDSRWVDLALQYFMHDLSDDHWNTRKTRSEDEIDQLIAWDI